VQQCGYAWNPNWRSNSKYDAGNADAYAHKWKHEEYQESSKEAFYEIIPHSIQMACHAFSDKA
jgi:hypothetical protein